MAATAERGATSASACETAVEESADYQVFNRQAPGGFTSLAAYANNNRTTPAEVKSIFAVHSAFGPCRKIRLEAANEISPLLVAPFADRYALTDAAYLGLVERKLTWGEFFRAIEAARVETKKQYDAVSAQVRRGLEQSHTAEVAQRQRAAAAINQWTYQQQVLAQQQQMLNTMNAPRTTNCQYIGAQLNCTTF